MHSLPARSPTTPLRLASAKGRFCSSASRALSNRRCEVISLCAVPGRRAGGGGGAQAAHPSTEEADLMSRMIEVWKRLSLSGRRGTAGDGGESVNNKIILDPLTFSEARFRPSLEERLESIISGAALMADSSCTRDDRRERIVAECNAVRQALQDLLSEYMNNCRGFQKQALALVGCFPICSRYHQQTRRLPESFPSTQFDSEIAGWSLTPFHARRLRRYHAAVHQAMLCRVSPPTSGTQTVVLAQMLLC
ncbi:catenin alpha-2 isoform X6 [Arapaima gigas]